LSPLLHPFIHILQLVSNFCWPFKWVQQKYWPAKVWLSRSSLEDEFTEGKWHSLFLQATIICLLRPTWSDLKALVTIPMPQVGPLPWPTCITLHNVQVPFQYRSSLGVSALLTNSNGGRETSLASGRGWPPHQRG
jgi:hypothetical protein